MTATLPTLSKRLAEASGASRMLDALIHIATTDYSRWKLSPDSELTLVPGNGYVLVNSCNVQRCDGPVSKYSESLDAALAFVERVLPGWGVKLEHNMGHGTSATVGHVGPNKLYDQSEGWAVGASPAIAVVAAAVDALAQQQEGGGE